MKPTLSLIEAHMQVPSFFQLKPRTKTGRKGHQKAQVTFMTRKCYAPYKQLRDRGRARVRRTAAFQHEKFVMFFHMIHTVIRPRTDSNSVSGARWILEDDNHKVDHKDYNVILWVTQLAKPRTSGVDFRGLIDKKQQGKKNILLFISVFGRGRFCAQKRLRTSRQAGADRRRALKSTQKWLMKCIYKSGGYSWVKFVEIYWNPELYPNIPNVP